MYRTENISQNDNPEIQSIVVLWENGIVKGFKSKEEAERYINSVCKKIAPDMDFTIAMDFSLSFV
jgi:hypothetical protein